MGKSEIEGVRRAIPSLEVLRSTLHNELSDSVLLVLPAFCLLLLASLWEECKRIEDKQAGKKRRSFLYSD